MESKKEKVGQRRRRYVHDQSIQKIDISERTYDDIDNAPAKEYRLYGIWCIHDISGVP